MKPLGKIHLWWLKQFSESYDRALTDKAHGGGVCVSGYEGTAYGRALIGLLDRGLIEYVCGFESGMDLLKITDKGRAQLAAQGDHNG